MPLVPLLSVVIVILPAVAWAATTTVCVNPRGTDGCFATIQGAVDSTAGDAVIDIAAGTYPERVQVLQGRKTLRGAGADVTTLSGPGIPGCPVSLCLYAPRTVISG